MFYVYVHRRVDTGAPFYVGKGKGDRAFRDNNRSAYWRNVVAKVGPPIVDFVVQDVDEELSFLVEREAINLHRRRGVKLVNLTDGGEGVSGLTRKQSETEIERRRLANTGRKRTPEQCARIAAAKVGHGLGRKDSPETIAKRAASNRGQKRPSVGEALRGRQRPAHVVTALVKSNAERYALRRAKLIDVLACFPTASLREICEKVGCDREMAAKYKNYLRGK